MYWWFQNIAMNCSPTWACIHSLSLQPKVYCCLTPKTPAKSVSSKKTPKSKKKLQLEENTEYTTPKTGKKLRFTDDEYLYQWWIVSLKSPKLLCPTLCMLIKIWYKSCRLKPWYSDMRKLFGDGKTNLLIKLPEVQQQTNGYDCGVHALANLVEFCYSGTYKN
jgi:hypothetical protein